LLTENQMHREALWIVDSDHMATPGRLG
jgi:hypothetical protein